MRPPSRNRVASDVVAAAANGDRTVVLAGEAHRVEHVGGAPAADDQRRAPIDHRVPDRARTVVRRVAWLDRAAQQSRAEVLDSAGRHRQGFYEVDVHCGHWFAPVSRHECRLSRHLSHAFA